MKNKKIKWGIIGCGDIAQKFATDLATINNAELYAVASRNQKKADEFAQQFNSKLAYNSYELLAQDANIDAVYIATPHPFHKENTILSLQHKKAVLCEKPLAMNLADVEEMITVAKENNVLLMEALWTCFLPNYQYVLEVINSKKYGELKEIHTDFGFKIDYDENSRLINKSLGGGSLLDIGIYCIFTALSTLGMQKKIEANATFFETGVDSECNMTFHYSQAKAYLKSTLLEDTPTEAVFKFEQATVKINSQFFRPSTVSIIQKGREELLDFGYTTIGYNYETLHFNDLIRNNQNESPIMSFDFSIKLITLLDKVRKIIGLEY